MRGLEESLCPNPAGHAWLKTLVSRSTRLLLEAFGPQAVEGVILTGSLARGEGSVLRDPGGLRLLGDLEMLVILWRSSDWPRTRRRMLELGQQAGQQVADGRPPVGVEYVPATIEYLRRRIRPSIFAYDLRRYGRVVWGRADLLGEIRPFAVGAIPQEDAVELVMNRLVELLMMGGAAPPAGAERTTRAYQLVKTVLDLAGSALAFAGCYVSSYAERPVAFDTLIASRPELGRAFADLPAFQEELRTASRCKIAPTTALLFRGDLGEHAASVLRWAWDLWAWELRVLLERPAASIPELVEAYLSREPLGRRLRGWAKYVRHPLRPRGRLDPLRAGRLLFKASPRRLTYAAAMLGHGGVAEGREEWRGRAAALLPFPPGPGDSDVVQQAGELWRWLVRNN